MTTVSKGGLALAKVIAQPYSGEPGVEAVMVGGSVALGRADQYSDLEIGVFWTHPPSVETRKRAIQHIGGEIWAFDRTPGNELYGLEDVTVDGRRYIGTAMISTHHLTTGKADEWLFEVVDLFETSLEKQQLAFTIQHGVPLYGEEWLQERKAKTHNYPRELAIKMVQENLWFGPWFCPEAFAARDDLLVLHQHIIWIEQGILKVLAGLNRIYYPSPEHKWMDGLIEEMRLAPSSISARLKQALRSDPLAAWEELRALMNETLSLVEAHLPDVDRVSLFESHPEVNIDWARRRWETSPPYSLMRELTSP